MTKKLRVIVIEDDVGMGECYRQDDQSRSVGGSRGDSRWRLLWERNAQN